MPWHSEQIYRMFKCNLITSYLKLLIHTEDLWTWKLTEWSSDYSAAFYVWVCDATHTVLDSSMDKRLHLSPSVVTQTQMHARTEEQPRYLWAAEHAQGNTLNTLRDYCWFLCPSLCLKSYVQIFLYTSYSITVKNDGWRRMKCSQTSLKTAIFPFMIKYLCINTSLQ